MEANETLVTPRADDATASGSEGAPTESSALVRRPGPSEVVEPGHTAVWLPFRCSDWGALEKLGIRRFNVPSIEEILVGDVMREVTEVFYVEATLPNYFSLRTFVEEDQLPDRRNFVILDGRGCRRAEIEDSCIESRFVNTHVLSRFDVIESRRTEAVPATVSVIDRQQQCELLRLESPGRRSASHDIWDEAWQWLGERYPDWHDRSAYWTE